MASSAGHLHQLVTRNLKMLRAAWKKSTRQLFRSPFPNRSELQTIYVRGTQRIPQNPLAFLRQTKGRFYTTRAINAVRNYATGHIRSGAQHRNANRPASSIVSNIANSPGRTPFATALRPNLTGGTIGRTASGYSLGGGRVGGARYFSHGPATSAEVIQHVSQSIRAFCLSGHRAQYSGTNTRGDKRFEVVRTCQHMTTAKLAFLPKTTPGSYVEFPVNPTITALTPISAVTGFSVCSASKKTLKSQGLLDVLSVDFSRALKDLAAVLNDLKSLSDLGDLPITYQEPTSLRVHFPGCDALTVENLCSEIGVKRGIVVQDEDLETFAGTEIALLFPFAPVEVESDRDHDSVAFNAHTRFGNPAVATEDWHHMICSDSSLHSARSGDNDLVYNLSDMQSFSAVDLGSLEEYESTPSQDHSLDDVFSRTPLEYQDFEGIYRFIELCDSARR